MGAGYALVDKKHLYESDDIDARFLVINNYTIWQVPLRQKDSNVLGGFVQVDTRTGVATWPNAVRSNRRRASINLRAASCRGSA